jgi:hypothetical protein
MSDYYKINTVGLPTYAWELKNATHVYVSTGLTIYERNFFSKFKNLSLTWCRQIIYLVITYLPNFHHNQSTYKTFFVDNFFICSRNVLLENKINTIKVKQI